MFAVELLGTELLGTEPIVLPGTEPVVLPGAELTMFPGTEPVVLLGVDTAGREAMVVAVGVVAVVALVVGVVDELELTEVTGAIELPIEFTVFADLATVTAGAWRMPGEDVPPIMAEAGIANPTVARPAAVHNSDLFMVGSFCRCCWQ